MFHWENGWFPIDFPTNPSQHGARSILLILEELRSSKLLPDLVTCNSAISGGKKTRFGGVSSHDFMGFNDFNGIFMGFSWDFNHRQWGSHDLMWFICGIFFCGLSIKNRVNSWGVLSWDCKASGNLLQFAIENSHVEIVDLPRPQFGDLPVFPPKKHSLPSYEPTYLSISYH